MPPSPQQLVEAQWFLPFFLIMWLGISGLLAVIGGWSSLSTLYRADTPAEGERFYFRSGSLGRGSFPVSYGGCLFPTINSQGLYLSIFLPFRFLSPPLFIPWSKVESIDLRRFLFFTYVVITLRDHWARISLRGAPGIKAKEEYEKAQTHAVL
jgi:hypothetical protein